MIAAATMDLRPDFAREVEHWKVAAERLADPESVASAAAWQSLELYLGIALRQMLAGVVARLRVLASDVDTFVRTAPASISSDALQARVVELREAYLRAETTVDFYADVLATRSIPKIAALLRSCDHIATRSMAEALAPLGKETPAALSYMDRGLGASILKYNLRLFDGTATNPVATIKVTRHNLLRPSALIHEAGHQVAFTLGWTPEVLESVRRTLGDGELGSYWSSTVSEICADAFAHVHTGYAAAVALHDVLDGTDAAVFRFIPGDPHPVSYVRVLLAIHMCRRTFGSGPWDRLADAWVVKHPISRCPFEVRGLLEHCVRTVPQVAELLLFTRYSAFEARSLAALIPPERVSPASLAKLERDAGPAAGTSPYWGWNEAIRLLALHGYRAGMDALGLRGAVLGQESWMLRLGAAVRT